MTKKCARCLEEKDLEEFGRNASRADGRHVYCRQCRSSSARHPDNFSIDGECFEAITADLEKLPEAIRFSGLAATARSLARELDSPRNSATSKSQVARSLLDTMAALDTLASRVPAADDAVDQLAKARAERRRRAASSTPVS